MSTALAQGACWGFRMFPALCLLMLGVAAQADEAEQHSLSEGSWMSTDVHRRTVLFDLLGDIWFLPMGGGEATVLTPAESWERQPRFSPNGRNIAYISDASGRDQVWVMDRDGDDPRPITLLSSGVARDPVWSPDGESIVYRHITDDDQSALWLQPLDSGAPPVPLTDPVRHPLAGEATAGEQGIWFSVRTAPFSPNGDPVAGLWQIMWLPWQGGEPVPVLAGAGSAARPTLSPDGHRLAFVSRDRDETLLEVLDLRNGQRSTLSRQLSRDQLEGTSREGTYPAFDWTDDGRGVVIWSRGTLWHVRGGGRQEPLPFSIVPQWTLPETYEIPTLPIDIPTMQAIGGLAWGPEEQVAFSAQGALWLWDTASPPERIADHAGDQPTWRADGQALAWSAGPGTGALNVQTFGWRGRQESVAMSHAFLNPAWGENSRTLTAVQQVTTHPSAPPWYALVLLNRRLGQWSVQPVATVNGYGPHRRPPAPSLHSGRIWFGAAVDEQTVFMSMDTDGDDHRVHLRIPGAENIVASPDGSKVAYQIGTDVFVVDVPSGDEPVDVADLPRIRASANTAQVMAWLADGSGLSWFDGTELHIRHFDDTEENVLHLALPPSEEAPRSQRIALTHARVLTMVEDGDVLTDATVLLEGARITAVSTGQPPPPDAEVIDCSGMTIIPGLIDTQAHPHADQGAARPRQEWPYLTALDYGITTLHDPVSHSAAALPQRERVAAGLQQGPRIMATGTPVFGAQSLEEALLQVARQQALGVSTIQLGTHASRQQQQWYATACRQHAVHCAATAAGIHHAMTLLLDGYTMITQAVPYTPLQADALGLWAQSNTTAIPSLTTTPDGLLGESHFFQQHNPIDDPRLRLHYPRRVLDQHAWRRDVLARDWRFESRARDAAALQQSGTPVALGSGGRLQGLGVHWELWALAGPGAMSPYAALQAATVNGAHALGIAEHVGTIEPGKVADLIVLHADPLADIHNSTQIALVIHRGMLHEPSP